MMSATPIAKPRTEKGGSTSFIVVLSLLCFISLTSGKPLVLTSKQDICCRACAQKGPVCLCHTASSLLSLPCDRRARSILTRRQLFRLAHSYFFKLKSECSPHQKLLQHQRTGIDCTASAPHVDTLFFPSASVLNKRTTSNSATFRVAA
jgi:hypothetical protein